MIVRADFETVSMAIYGEVVTDATAPVTSYSPGPLDLPDPVYISPALDLANVSDPTCLAKQFLALIPNAPPLNLVICLMFCLKPPNDDWDLPDFPRLYADLNEEETDIDLDSAFRCLSRPVAEDVSVLCSDLRRRLQMRSAQWFVQILKLHFSQSTIIQQVG